MSSDTIEQKRGTAFYGKKKSDGDYGSDEYGIHVQFDMDGELDENIRGAFYTAKQHVLDQLGINYELDAEGILRTAFPGAQSVAPSANDAYAKYQAPAAPSATVPVPYQTGDTRPPVRVIKPWGDVPNWLVEEAAKAGVAEVFDNRSKLKMNGGSWSDKSPWFKEALPKGANTDDAKGFWPPR